jgi:hypothetical protein
MSWVTSCDLAHFFEGASRRSGHADRPLRPTPHLQRANSTPVLHATLMKQVNSQAGWGLPPGGRCG